MTDSLSLGDVELLLTSRMVEVSDYFMQEKQPGAGVETSILNRKKVRGQQLQCTCHAQKLLIGLFRRYQLRKIRR